MAADGTRRTAALDAGDAHLSAARVVRRQQSGTEFLAAAARCRGSSSERGEQMRSDETVVRICERASTPTGSAIEYNRCPPGNREYGAALHRCQHVIARAAATGSGQNYDNGIVTAAVRLPGCALTSQRLAKSCRTVGRPRTTTAWASSRTRPTRDGQVGAPARPTSPRRHRTPSGRGAFNVSMSARDVPLASVRRLGAAAERTVTASRAEPPPGAFGDHARVEDRRVSW